MAEKQRVVFDMSPKLVEQIDMVAESEMLSRSAWIRRTVRAGLVRALAADFAKAASEGARS
jgi:metal-responsive CopG/Arc/MetJ family transcriptional regulator